MLSFDNLRSLLNNVAMVSALLAGFAGAGALGYTRGDVEASIAYIETYEKAYGGSPDNISASSWYLRTEAERREAVTGMSNELCWQASVAMGSAMTALSVSMLLYVVTFYPPLEARAHEPRVWWYVIAPPCLLISVTVIVSFWQFFVFMQNVLKLQNYGAYLRLENQGGTTTTVFAIVIWGISLFLAVSTVAVTRGPAKPKVEVKK